MQKTILKKGLTLLTEKKKTDSVAIEVCAKVGSNNEPYSLNGISHFVEHMLFEGTKKRKNAKEITNEIESLGGDFNAFTSNERTCYYIKSLSRHFDKALDILADITQNPLFEDRKIEKERKVILREIDMVDDEPRHYQWVMFFKNLFQNHPAKNPIYGRYEVVSKLTRHDLISYYKKYYLANNIIISAVGNIDGIRKNVESAFSGLRKGPLPKMSVVHEPVQIKPKVVVEKKKTQSSYMVLGYKTPGRLHEDSYALDVIKSILGRGQSGIIVDEIRNKRGMAYSIGVSHDPSIDNGSFAVYLNLSRKKIPLAKNLILKEFKSLNNVSSKELKDAKGYIEGQFLLDQEDTHEHSDTLCFWELIKDSKLADDYIARINNITKDDVAKAARKYLNQNYTMAVIEEK